ncbi:MULTISPECIES: penicillin-binding protein PBP2B [Streptococcus]|uniref:Penicillin-binding protein PBP2B n=1 Tax=Streptococcus caledonicus TaxID=2614158 RepID=A0ABW0UG17_9STRE|nr:penicillin-binding protein PBP2B [Streptococcus sp. S784/96/1]
MASRNRKQLQQQKRLGNQMSSRINLIFAVIVVLFIILLLRLAQMQLLDKTFYTEKLTATTSYTVKNSSPRGKIYDAQGTLLVDNDIKEVVSFTRSNFATAEEMKKTAWALSALVSYTETNVTTREKKDYYLADSANYQAVLDRLDKSKKFDKFGNRLAESDVYANAVEAVTDEQINFSDEELKVAYIFSQMNATPTFGTTSLKTVELTAEQIAIISANKDLPGISVRSDWERKNIAQSLSPIIGKVSSEKAGLPAEEVKEYLAKGYSLNDRVGTSYLEKAYEDTLKGTPKVRQITVDKKGTIVDDNETQSGSRGKNIKLTIDLKFQEGVEKIINQYFLAEKAEGNVELSEGAYAVALNPHTGAVLAMAGLSHDTETGEIVQNALGAMTLVFTPGSVIKGATIASGYENGIISGNQILYDQAIQFAGSSPIKSWFTLGSLPITATQALAYSSNTYMVQIAMKMMGQEYSPGMILSTSGLDSAMAKLRATYADFGLGVSTGLDVPGESTGYIPEKFDSAAILTESFGQFDNYTTMQLAQYVATVANGGNRIAPRLVQGFYDTDESGNLGNMIEEKGPNTLNTIKISTDELEIIQEGFYDVVNSSSGYATGKAIGEGAAVSISAKTGTAESYVTNKSGDSIYTTNMNVVAYAPSHNPKIAVAVVLPHETNFNSKASHLMTRDIINLYHNLYPMN